VAFQPHRYTRTQALLEEFGSAFVGADKLFLTDIYAASERPIEGVNGRMLHQTVVASGQSEAVFEADPEMLVVRLFAETRPGDLVHLDIKGMTCFSEVSLRGDGRLRGKQKHPGFLALHVAVDDHSRMAFTQMLPDQKAETTIGFLEAAVQFFAHHGIGVRALLTDNGSSYRSRQFRQTCDGLGIRHHRTRPYTPRTNGKAERFIQTTLREWAYAKHWIDSDERDACLKPWTDFYNYLRPHGSLNYKPPISRSDDGTTS